jgi:hypothetical protein
MKQETVLDLFTKQHKAVWLADGSLTKQLRIRS